MRSIVGLALLMTGLSIGTYAYYPQSVQQHVSLANITRVIAPVAQQAVIAAQPASKTTLSGTSAHQKTNADQRSINRNFSPGSHLFAQVASGNKTTKTKRHQALKKGPQGQSDTITTASLQPRDQEPFLNRRLVSSRAGWSTVVTPATPPKSGNHPLKSSLPADGSARYALVRDIQRELKRVGCYWGKIDGDWGPGSKRAITGFIKTVNAALPTRDPDYILLALIRSQQDQVCGTSQEQAIIASRSKPQAPNPDASVHTFQRPRLVAHPRLVQRASSQYAQIAPPAKPVAATSSNRTSQTVIAHRQPLPGHMAMGGPRPNELNATETAPGVSSLPNTYRATRPTYAPTAFAPLKPAKRVRKKSRRHASISTARSKKKTRRRSYRRRRSKSPLSNLLRQGVN